MRSTMSHLASSKIVGNHLISMITTTAWLYYDYSWYSGILAVYVHIGKMIVRVRTRTYVYRRI